MLAQIIKDRLKNWPTTLAVLRMARKVGWTRPDEIRFHWQVLRQQRAGRFPDAIARLKAYAERSQDVPTAVSDLAYEVYDAYLRSTHETGGKLPDYDRFGLYLGVLAPPLLDAVLAEIRAAPAGVPSAGDFDPGYYPSYDPKIAATLGDVHRFVRFDLAQRKRLSDLFSTAAPPIERCLGVPARVVNLKAWWTRAEAVSVGMNDWHTDGMPPQICKLMVYPFGAGTSAGTTVFRYGDGSLRAVEGPAGVYAIFKNSTIVHRGIAPQAGERVVIELTLAPYVSTDWRMANGGPVASYPKFPWAELPL